MALKLITPPAIEPVSLADARFHLRVDSTDEDDLICGFIRSAREYCENFQNRAYLQQTWQLWRDEWPDEDEIELPRPPLASVAHIKYYDTDNTEYTLDASDYFVDAMSEPGRVVLAYNESWPSTTLRPANGVVVEYVAGFATADEVPMRVRQAILLLVGHWYENREAVMVGSISKEVEFAVHSLLWPDRVVPT